MWLNPQFPADLVTFTEEGLNGKLHFVFSDNAVWAKPNMVNVNEMDYDL